MRRGPPGRRSRRPPGTARRPSASRSALRVTTTRPSLSRGGTLASSSNPATSSEAPTAARSTDSRQSTSGPRSTARQPRTASMRGSGAVNRGAIGQHQLDDVPGPERPSNGHRSGAAPRLLGFAIRRAHDQPCPLGPGGHPQRQGPLRGRVVQRRAPGSTRRAGSRSRPRGRVRARRRGSCGSTPARTGAAAARRRRPSRGTRRGSRRCGRRWAGSTTPRTRERAATTMPRAVA